MAATGIGDQLYALEPSLNYWVVLIHPEIAISTPWVYQHPDLLKNESPRGTISLGEGCCIEGTQEFHAAISAYGSGNIYALLQNSMENPVFGEHPELESYKDKLEATGCIKALMSGSGSTIFGLCETEEDAKEVGKQLGNVKFSVAPFVGCGIEDVS